MTSFRDSTSTKSLFSTAEQDADVAGRKVETPQTKSPSYRLAYADPDFLLREELRSVRLQLELLKPELEMQENDIDSTIVVFGSARIPSASASSTSGALPGSLAEKSPYYDMARTFARLASEGQIQHQQRCVIVTGGGGGIMEAANRGAADVGAPSIGLNVVLPEEQTPNRYITPSLSFQFHYFAIRKLHFLLRAKALAIFPGGFGTVDELFDALTLIQTGKMQRIPIVLFGSRYWRRVINFEAMVDEGVIDKGDLELVDYVETAQEGWRVICEFYS